MVPSKVGIHWRIGRRCDGWADHVWPNQLEFLREARKVPTTTVFACLGSTEADGTAASAVGEWRGVRTAAQ